MDFDGNTAFPSSIIIFRAGMNEYDLSCGESKLEIDHIRWIINSYMRKKRVNRNFPRLTYLGYNRAHNIRLSLADNVKEAALQLKSDTDIEGVVMNCPAGTVVDQEIVNPNSFLFISHETFTVSVHFY